MGTGTGACYRSQWDGFIERHALHTNSLPVPIEQAARNEGWTIRRTPGMGPVLGFAVISADHSQRIMRVNADESLYVQRAVIAHEICHWLSGDDTSAFIEDLWSDAKQEHRAWVGAAYLLIPNHVLVPPMDVQSIAQQTETPDWLVRNAIEQRLGV